jgi:hypothetical protein
MFHQRRGRGRAVLMVRNPIAALAAPAVTRAARRKSKKKAGLFALKPASVDQTEARIARH